MVEILLIVVDILNVAEVLLISLFKSQSNVRILHCCILFYCCTVSSAFTGGDVTCFAEARRWIAQYGATPLINILYQVLSLLARTDVLIRKICGSLESWYGASGTRGCCVRIAFYWRLGIASGCVTALFYWCLDIVALCPLLLLKELWLVLPGRGAE